MAFIGALLCDSYGAQWFTFTTSFYPHNNSVKQELLASYTDEENEAHKA